MTLRDTVVKTTMRPTPPARPRTVALPGGAAITRETAEELLTASQALLDQAGRGSPGPRTADCALTLSELCVAVYRADPELRKAAIGSLGNLGPVLAGLDLWDCLESAYARTVVEENHCPSVAETLQSAWINTLLAVARPGNEPRILSLVSLADRLARKEPRQVHRFHAAAELAHQALRYFGTQRDWIMVEEILGNLERIPVEFAAGTSGPRARALGTAAILSLDQGDGERAVRYLRGALLLARSHPSLAVHEELLGVLPCFVEARLNRGTDVLPLEELLGPLPGLVTPFLEHRPLVLSFARNSGLILVSALAGAGAATVDGLLALHDRIASGHPGDEEIAFALARGLTAAARSLSPPPRPPGLLWRALSLIRREAPRPRSPAGSGLGETMARLCSRLPASPYLSVERKEFDAALARS